MAEKEIEFVVKDRRKFNPDGERREGAPEHAEEWKESHVLKEMPSVSVTPPASLTPPAAKAVASARVAPHDASPTATDDASPTATDDASLTATDDELPAAPSATESSEALTAYRASSKHLDEMVHAANPGMQPVPEMDFARLVQSIYMSALMQMGAGTPDGQQPRLDILGARQSIDMLGVLGDKTGGNLSSEEFNLLQSALFELRMGFLEITQAIARSATQQQPKAAADAPGKPTLVR